ncbi:hypothetical protein D3C71_800320 [compost metagenome]
MPDRTHRHLAVDHQLLALGPRTPERQDVRLDLVDLLQGPWHVQRVQLVSWNAVGQQRRFEHAVHPFVQRALAGEFLHVPEIGPGLGPVFTEFFAVPGHHVAELVAGDAVIGRERRGHLIALDGVVVQWLQDLFPAQHDGAVALDVDHVPARLAAGQLRADGAFGRAGSVDAHLDAGVLGEGVGPRRAERVQGVAAPVDHHQRLVRRPADAAAQRQWHRGQQAHGLDEGAAVDLTVAGLFDKHFDAVLLVILAHGQVLSRRAPAWAPAFLLSLEESFVSQILGVQACSRKLCCTGQLSHTGAPLGICAPGWLPGTDRLIGSVSPPTFNARWVLEP